MSIGHLLLVLFGFAVYFAPWLTASSRKHRNRAAIAVLNFFLGWTGIGWIVALVWAYTDNREVAVARPSVAPGG